MAALVTLSLLQGKTRQMTAMTELHLLILSSRKWTASRRILESFVSQKIEKMLNNKSYSNIRGGIVMKQITDEELRAIRERAEKATAGEWQIADTTDGVWLIDEDDLIIAGTFERIEDAVFSKHARQDIPKLLAEIDRLSRLYC